MNILMECASTAKKHVVSHLDMPGQQYVIGKDIPAPHLYIMCQVDTGHQKVGICDLGATAIYVAAVNGNIFTNTVIITNHHITFGFWFEG